MKRALLAVALILAVAALPAYALTQFYSSGVNGVSVSQANAKNQFTYNVSGGTSVAMAAHYVVVFNRDASANACFFRLDHSPATTADIRVPIGKAITFSWDERDQGEGFTYYAAICSTGETATFDVSASR